MAWTPNLGAQQISVGTLQPHAQYNEGIHILAKAAGGVGYLDFAATTILTLSQEHAANAILIAAGTTGASTAIVPASSHLWEFINDAGHPITVKTLAQSGGPVVPAGDRLLLVSTGDGVRAVTL